MQAHARRTEACLTGASAADPGHGGEATQVVVLATDPAAVDQNTVAGTCVSSVGSNRERGGPSPL